MVRYASLAVVVLFLLMAGNSFARQVTPLDDGLVSVVTDTRGETREAALLLAKEQAVTATAGRVLLDDKLLRADELLEKYLRNYASNFVLGVEVLNDEFTGGYTVLKSRVFVDYAKLVDDLREKRFLYEPAYTPQFFVFLDETLDGREIDQKPAREILSNALTTQGFKPYDGMDISDPPANVNILEDPLLLRSAIVSAERRNIEIIITGEARMTLREESDVYYDHFYFYDCEMDVQMVRVDTGEVLLSKTAKNSGSARDRAEAISLAIQRTARIIADEFYTEYRATWPKLVQSRATYEILLTGTDDELINIISQHLERAEPNTRIFVKKKFDGTAILSVDTAADRDAIIETLRMCPYPTLKIVREKGEDKFEVQVSG